MTQSWRCSTASWLGSRPARPSHNGGNDRWIFVGRLLRRALARVVRRVDEGQLERAHAVNLLVRRTRSLPPAQLIL